MTTSQMQGEESQNPEKPGLSLDEWEKLMEDPNEFIRLFKERITPEVWQQAIKEQEAKEIEQGKGMPKTVWRDDD